MINHKKSSSSATTSHYTENKQKMADKIQKYFYNTEKNSQIGRAHV